MIRIAFMCGICFLGANIVEASPLVIDGLPQGEFILMKNAHQAEIFGVDDVCHWIEKITGVKVPVLSSPSSQANIKIFVGTGFAGYYKEDMALLEGNDGFAVRRKGNHVYVFGSRPRGTLYGLYALLERNSDIIFARPAEPFGTVHGQTNHMELAETDFIEIPVFLFRALGPGWPRHRPTGMWLLRNRDNRRDIRASYEGFKELDLIEAMSTNFAVPISKHAEEHPEYFGYDPVNKTRRFVRHGEGTMCLSVPQLPEIWAKGLAEMVDAHEKRVGRPVDNVRIGPGDNWFCCQCDKCLAPIALPNGDTLTCKDPDSIKDPLFRSTQIFMFLNEAVEAWQKLRPNIPLHVLAYIHFAEPPLVDIHPKLGIYFAPYAKNNMHFPLLDPKQPEPWGRRFEKWLTMNPRLGFYEYYFSKPSPMAFYTADNLRAILRCPDYKNAIVYSECDNDHGVRGIGENRLGWDVGPMNLWVISRLFWDPNQDVDTLYRYYIERTYREAAPQMLAYYELIKASWLDPEDKTIDAAHASILGIYNNMIVKKGLEPKCLSLLAEAERVANHPHSKIMIGRMRDQFMSLSKSMARLVVPHIPKIAQNSSFDSLQWEKPPVCDDFKLTTRTGEQIGSAEMTSIAAAHDGKYLYLRFIASDTAIERQDALQPDKNIERWPKGDHMEFWLFAGPNRYVLAFNADGTMYDARNLDRRWDSQWQLEARKIENGWEAIARLPLSTFNFTPGNETHFRWFCTREISHKDKPTKHLSYQGRPLYYRNFPIVIQ